MWAPVLGIMVHMHMYVSYVKKMASNITYLLGILATLQNSTFLGYVLCNAKKQFLGECVLVVLSSITTQLR